MTVVARLPGGIAIVFYYDDHPPAHFHAIVNGINVPFDIDEPMPIRGMLSPSHHRTIRGWAMRHRDELFLNWALARAYQPLASIGYP